MPVSIQWFRKFFQTRPPLEICLLEMLRIERKALFRSYKVRKYAHKKNLRRQRDVYEQRLSADIERVIKGGLNVVNICSEPLEAAYVRRELTGKDFTNDAAPLVREDMRSIHTGVFGGTRRDLKAANSSSHRNNAPDHAATDIACTPKPYGANESKF
jgi:hypothetical protein